MPLVPVAPVVFLLERVGARVAKCEWIPLVVVVRLVERKRVIDLELESLAEGTSQLRGYAVVTGLRTAFDGDELQQPIAAGKSGSPGAAEHRGIPIDEPGEVVTARVGVAERSHQARHDLLVEPDGCRKGSRILKVFVEYEDLSRKERHSGGRRQQLAIIRRRAAENGFTAVETHERLASRPVRAPAAGQIQSRYTGIVDPSVGPHDRPAIAPNVVGDAQARLKHRVVA